MDKPTKFLLPTPNFDKTKILPSKPHFLTPSGMTLLTSDKQPPPMYGPKGSTVPSKYLNQPTNNSQPEKPPERHFCEPCEMELQSKDDFRRHRSQHEVCPVDGCKFKAHPCVMDKHVTEMHASGVFDKIKKLSTPEEIAAWRDERRKKYPTLANAKMRQLAIEQRQKRGERLEENKARFGRSDDRKRARITNNEQKEKNTQGDVNQRKTNDRNLKWKDRRQKRVDEKNANSIKTNEHSEAVDDKISCGIRMFEGTSKLKDYKHEKAKKQEVKNVLSGLLGMYGSDDETDNNSECENDLEDEVVVAKELEKETNQHVSVLNINTNIHEIVILQNEISIADTNVEELVESTKTFSSNTVKESIKICSEPTLEIPEPSCAKQITETEELLQKVCTQDSSDEGPEEAPIQHTCKETNIATTEQRTVSKEANDSLESKPPPKRQKLEDSNHKTQQQKRKYGLDYRKQRIRKQNTMLEKLLEPDIRHERNVLLQCVRFVCENNFFGIGSKKDE